MQDAAYKDLMLALGSVVRIDDPQALAEHGQIVVDDIRFSLYPGQDDRLLVYCDFGLPPEERRADALSALLETNLFMFDGSGPTFAINPESGHVIFADHYSTTQLDGELLAAVLAKLAKDATEWRRTYFLDDTPEAVQPTTNGSNQLRL
ncbi:MAG TPA: CesT family type III secretion system chaperone [Burkholderiaceae bacterium]|nr:CesT family type III secretion system chaperone [Burkholderiaceae bacterium]